MRLDTIYLSSAEMELRASTQKGYREIWKNHISGRVGQIRLREFSRTKAFAPVIEAMERMQTSVDLLEQSPAIVSRCP